VDCELYLLLIQWLSTYVYRCTRPPATVTNPHIVLSLGSKETHIQSHNRLVVVSACCRSGGPSVCWYLVDYSASSSGLTSAIDHIHNFDLVDILAV